ncbi:MAG TPA: DUF1634 domain-containing protein [Thermoanaerobaculia bacterium]|nr:DUF1634 domain-containing protein [Thermoanaerobaculia bacterium]
MLISRLLRTGVAASAALVVIGMLLVFGHHPTYRSSHTELAPLLSATAIYPHSVRAVLAAARAGRGQGIAMIGLLLLIATPVARVAVSIGIFIRARDWRFVIITATVLLLLIASFALGAAGR